MRCSATTKCRRMPLSTATTSPNVDLPALLVAAGLAGSNVRARRAIDAGGVKINGTAVAPRQYDVDGSDLEGKVVSVGKRKVARVTKADS